jgi:hypothetical protein
MNNHIAKNIISSYGLTRLVLKLISPPENPHPKTRLGKPIAVQIIRRDLYHDLSFNYSSYGVVRTSFRASLYGSKPNVVTPRK